MMKILLLTDFSNNSKNASEFAIGIFGYENVEYFLLNTYTEAYVTSDVLVSFKDFLKKESGKGLKKEQAYLSNKFPDKLINIKKLSEYGELIDVTNRITKRQNIDFVVMGTTGLTGIEKALIGSKTTDVIKEVMYPIMVVPENAKFKSLSLIALAADYDELRYKDVLNPIVKLVEEYQAKLMIVNIQQKEEVVSATQATEAIQLDHVLEKIPHLFYGIKHKNIVKGLNQFIEEHKVDLLVMVVRKRSFFDRLFHVSITKNMSMIADLPILFLHE